MQVSGESRGYVSVLPQYFENVWGFSLCLSLIFEQKETTGGQVKVLPKTASWWHVDEIEDTSCYIH